MPTAKPRITLTLEAHPYEVLSRLSRASGVSMASHVSALIDAALPPMERMVVVLERANAAPEEVRAGLVAAVERAERDLMPRIEAALDQGDMFLASVEAATRPGKAPRAQRGVPGRGAGASNPRPVTRG
jgi:hypothetical protein